MPTLGVKVKVDHSELGEAEGRVAAFAEKFEHHFSKHLGKLFGAGALAGGIFKIGEKIFGEPEEIEKTAKALGFTTDEIQYLTKAAKNAGLTLEEYLSRAEKQAVDLGAVIKKMRERGDFKIIDEKDIENINAVTSLEKKQIDDVTKKATSMTGAYIAWLRGLLPRWRILDIKEKRNRGIPLTSAEEETWAGYVSGNIVRHKFSPAAPPTEDKSQGMLDYEAKIYLRSRIRKLQDQARALQAEGHLETIRPELTARQQVGAYAGGRVSVISAISETNRKLDDIRTEIENFETKLTGIP